MIVLTSVTKIYGRWRNKKIVLNNATATFEAKGNYVILGLPKSGKTTLLNVLSGITVPTRGSVLRYGRVGYTVGFTGIGQPRFSGRELVVILANLYEADANEVIDFVTSFSELGSDMRRPVVELDYTSKIHLFFTLGYAFPLDFYLFDGSLASGSEHFRRKCRAAFEVRREEAGTIWVTRDYHNAKLYGTKGGIIHDGELRLFDSIDEALDEFQTYRRVADRGTLSYARDLVKTGDTAEARTYLREYLITRRDDVAAYELLVGLASKAGDDREVRAVCESALHYFPNATVFHVSLAKLAERERNYPNVVKHAQDALAIDPANYHAQTLLAKTCETVGLDEEAAAIWSYTADRHKDLKLWLAAIRTNAKIGNWEQATSRINTAIALFGPPAGVALTDLRIRALLETGHLKDVEDMLLTLGEQDIDKAVATIHQLAAKADVPTIVRLTHTLHLKFDLSKNLASRNLRYLLDLIERRGAEIQNDKDVIAITELVDKIRRRPPHTRETLAAISRGKPSFQSSVYGQWGPHFGNDGKVGDRRKYFHTKKEKEPWWKVDLERMTNIRTIYVFDRDGQAERSKTLIVEVSPDDCDYQAIYDRMGAITNQSVTAIHWVGQARYVRVRLAGADFLHLEQVAVIEDSMRGPISSAPPSDQLSEQEAPRHPNPSGQLP